MNIDSPSDPRDGLDPEDELMRAEQFLADLDGAGGVSPTPHAEVHGDLEKLYEISRELLTAVDLPELLPRILRVALATSGAERGIVFRFEAATGAAIPAAVEGCDLAALGEAEAYSRTVLDEARSRVGVLSQDTGGDPRYQDIASLTLHEIRSLLCVPITNEERVLGALYLDNRQSDRRFTRHATRIVGILAGLSAVAIQNAERYGELSRRTQQLSRELGRYAQFDEIVGRSRPMLEMLKVLDRVTATDFPVLLRGESGTGKELLCRAIHRSGARANGPLVVQNCAAVPAELLESEFFGHTRGAFTGAHIEREGLFRRAHGGTLFLDEVAELDIRLQAKLLRVLEEGKVRPVGSEVEYPVDFRLISATSVEMKKAVEEGRMRRDLYYRLNVVAVQIPALRERPGDIPMLVHHFTRKYQQARSRGELTFSRAAIERLQHLHWAGNVRELEHVVQRALVLVEGPVVEPVDLERLLDLDVTASAGAQLPVGQMTLAAMEEQAIREALRRTEGNKAQAAQLLGIHRNALLRRIEKLRFDGERS